MKKKGEIEKFDKSKVPNEPVKLPDGFNWDEFDIDDDKQLEELREFLEDHYVEDNIGNFRLKYSNEKLRWGLAIPGFLKELQFLVRDAKKGKIMACLFGIPRTFMICG